MSIHCNHDGCVLQGYIHCPLCKEAYCYHHACSVCRFCYACKGLEPTPDSVCDDCRRFLGCAHKNCKNEHCRNCKTCSLSMCKKHSCSTCGRCRGCRNKRKGPWIQVVAQEPVVPGKSGFW